MRPLLIASLVVISMAGCAHTDVRIHDDQIRTEASILSAQRTGATNLPAAAEHLQLAEEENAAARRLIDSGDVDRARTVLKRAAADADLAVALAEEAPLRSQADEVLRQAKALQSSV